MPDTVINIINAWGPPGVLAAFMWIMLNRSEAREKLKDLRIQLLENLLTESYDERISAANQVSEALHGNAVALSALTNEIRAKNNA
jgi:hypothetical protein